MAERQPEKLTVTSKTFKHGDTLPKSTRFDGMGAGGDNRSPHLQWSGAPPDTKSYAVIVHDPDAPTGTGFFHWVVFNIPAGVTELEENSGEKGHKGLPKGAKHGHTDFGAPHYGGAAPPPGHGPHHYDFHVYALDVPELPADETATAALLRFMMRGHVVGEGVLTGISER
jgi:Raf kinase inhibitor-like YbhB/YbcL family protein